jgi:hypothetical protein
MNMTYTFSKLRLAILCAALVLLGFIGFASIRLLGVPHDETHYHANFALYINGIRDEFKNFTFYEEVAACTGTNVFSPKSRTHMHDQNSHLIHVHDGGVTWGNFFENLGYTLGDTLVKTDKGLYVQGQDGNTLTFWLNGEPQTHIANTIIQSKDALLISYGTADKTTLQKQYDSIEKDAAEWNVKKDPNACSGGESNTFWHRVQRAVWY